MILLGLGLAEASLPFSVCYCEIGKRLAYTAQARRFSCWPASVALRWCWASRRALKARTAVPLRGGGRREEFGAGSI